MWENVCTLPLSAELFTQAIHPKEPVLAVGLATGHVECFRLPAAERSLDDEDGGSADISIVSDGKGTIDTAWRTRRHKGSCRALAFSDDGSAAYSAGSDGLLKHFSPATGQVSSKITMPGTRTTDIDPPTLMHVLSPQTILVACDSGALHQFDLRDYALATSKPQATHAPHLDYVSAIAPLPPTDTSTSGYSKQWVSVGGTTLAVTDLRRGVLVRSDDQEDELLSAVFVPGIGPKKARANGVVAVGTGAGVLTMWDKGAWDDQTDRIIVDKAGESLDCLVHVPDEVANGKKVGVGVGDGTVRIVDLNSRHVETTLRHDDMEGVTGLGFDCQGRMISGGGSIIKVWEDSSIPAAGGGSDSDDSDADGDDSDDDDEPASNGKQAKRQASSDEDSDNSDGEEVSKKRKKRKKGGKAVKVGPHGQHGILKFDGLD